MSTCQWCLNRGGECAICEHNALQAELTELRRVRDAASKVVQRGYFEDRYHFIVDGDLLRELRDQLANREGE